MSEEMRLTMERIEEIRPADSWMSFWRTPVITIELRQLCDLALSALSQEAVRDEALEEAAKVCDKKADDWAVNNLAHAAQWTQESAAAIRALKCEPNAAAWDRSTERASGERTSAGTSPSPAPAAPDVARIIELLKEGATVLDEPYHRRAIANAMLDAAALLSKLGQGRSERPLSGEPCPLCGRTDPHSHTSGPLGMS